MMSNSDQLAREFLNTHIVNNKALLDIDLARLGLLIEFCNNVISKLEFNSNDQIHVAVVSGSLGDPELSFLSENCNVEVLSYEHDKKFDLHKDWNTPDFKDVRSRYDLVLCHQVLEHVADPMLAFKNLSKLAKKGGFIYVNVPGINNIHSDPQYYYAGFHPRALSFFATKAKLEIISSGGVYSEKISKMHATCDWIPCKYSLGFKFALLLGLRTRDPKKLLRALRHGVRAKLRYPKDAAMTSSGDYLCASWILAKKIF